MEDLVYNAEFVYFVLHNSSNEVYLVTFTKDSNVIDGGAGASFTDPELGLKEYDRIRPLGTTRWYTIGLVEDDDSAILTEKFEESTTTWMAQRDRQAYRIGGIGGLCKISNSGNVNGARGVNGAVEVTSSGNVTGAAIGTRGSISMSGTGNVGLASCVGTYALVSNGTCNLLTGMGVEPPFISGNGKVTNYIGVGCSNLAREGLNQPDRSLWEYGNTPSFVDNWFGFRQDGNEHNLFHGYMDVATIIGKPYEDEQPFKQQDSSWVRDPAVDVSERCNYKAASVIQGESKYFEPDGEEVDPEESINVDTLIGYKYETPSLTPFRDPVNHTASIMNSYGIYLQSAKTAFVTNAWGIYQAGDDPDYFGGSLSTAGNISVAGYDSVEGSHQVRAYVSTLQANLTRDNWIIVDYDEPNYDNKGGWIYNDDIDHWVFQPNIAGYYRVDACISLVFDPESESSIPKAYGLGIFINDNNTPTAQEFSHAACMDEFSVNVHNRVYLDGDDDYMVIKVKSKSGDNTVDIKAGSENSYVLVQWDSKKEPMPVP